MPIVVKYEAPGIAVNAAANASQYQVGQDAWRQGLQERQVRNSEIARDQDYQLQQQRMRAAEEQAAQQQLNYDAQLAERHMAEQEQREMAYRQMENQDRAQRSRAGLQRDQMEQQARLAQSLEQGRNDRFVQGLDSRQDLQSQRLGAQDDMLDRRLNTQQGMQDQRLGYQGYQADQNRDFRQQLQDDQQGFTGQQNAANRQLQQQGLDQRASDAAAGRQLRNDNTDYNRQKALAEANLQAAEDDIKAATQIILSPNSFGPLRDRAQQDLPQLQDQLRRARAAYSQLLSASDTGPTTQPTTQPAQAMPAMPQQGMPTTRPSGTGYPPVSPTTRPNISGAPPELPMVRTPQEAMQLPPGTAFLTPDGRIKVRP